MFLQIVEATSVNSGDTVNATFLDCILHVIAFPWKIIVALIPPPMICGGWLCFFIALSIIGLITAIIGKFFFRFPSILVLNKIIFFDAYDKLCFFSLIFSFAIWFKMVILFFQHFKNSGDFANIFGCMVGLKDTATAITLVALGTSLPDTIASKIAAENVTSCTFC